MVSYNLFLYDQWKLSPTLIWPLNQSIFHLKHHCTDLDSVRQEHQLMQHIRLNPFIGLKPAFKGFDSVSEKQHTLFSTSRNLYLTSDRMPILIKTLNDILLYNLCYIII